MGKKRNYNKQQIQESFIRVSVKILISTYRSLVQKVGYDCVPEGDDMIIYFYFTNK